MAYLHGVETQHVGDVPKNVSEVKTAVVGIIGVPSYGFKETIDANGIVVLTKQGDIEKKFGVVSESGKLPDYLDKMYAQFEANLPIVLVKSVGVTTVAAASKSPDSGSGVIDLGHTNVSSVVVKSEDKSVTYTVSTDYTVDTSTGKITILRTVPENYFVSFEYGSDDEGEGVFTPAPATITLGQTKIGAVVVKDSTETTTYAEGEDYTVDYSTGVVTLLKDITTAKKVAYQYSAATATAADIAGNGSATPKTGIAGFYDAQTLTGYVPKILVAPGFSGEKLVADALAVAANRLKARAFVDADTSTINTVDLAILARKDSAKSFGIHEKRVNLCFPALKIGSQTYPMSVAAAGVRARVDLDPSKGYHWSISSQKINGFDGLDIAVEYSINNPSADSQRLNAAGILTVKNASGLKFCGNLNSSFDENNAGSTDHEIFECTATVGDVIEESIEYYTEQRIDQPLTNPWIDGVVGDVNAFLRTLTSRGAIAGGECWYEPADNDPLDLKAGHIKFRYDDAATPPADRITYQRSYNVEYLRNLGQ